MPEKRQTDRSSKNRVRIPKQPPKEPRQDYSALPQKPIKLKHDVELSPALQKRKSEQHASKGNTSPVAKKKPAKRVTARTSQPLNGISHRAREFALESAEREGISVTTWLERVILDRAKEPNRETPLETDTILQTLKEINQRLNRLENQKGFWRRFWEQYIEPYQQ
jgi:hypothetical protein